MKDMLDCDGCGELKLVQECVVKDQEGFFDHAGNLCDTCKFEKGAVDVHDEEVVQYLVTHLGVAV